MGTRPVLLLILLLSGLPGCGDSREALTEKLCSEDPMIRAAAALDLGGLGEDAEPATIALLSAIHDEVLAVRRNAAWALGEIGAVPSVVNGLLVELGSPGGWRGAAQAFEFLGKKEHGRIPQIAGALRSEDADRRMLAAWALGAMGPGARAMEKDVADLREDPHEGVRAVAEEAYGRIRGHSEDHRPSEDLPSLMRQLAGADGSLLRAEAALALGFADLPEPEVVDALESALGDPSLPVRWNAVVSLALLSNSSPTGQRAEAALARVETGDDAVLRRAAAWGRTTDGERPPPAPAALLHLGAVQSEARALDAMLPAVAEREGLSPDALTAAVGKFQYTEPRWLYWEILLENQQGKINVNTAPPALLANLIATSHLVRADKIASHVVSRTPGEFVPWSGLAEVRTFLSTFMTTAESDRVLRHLTCWSGGDTAGVWCNRQTIRADISPDDSPASVRADDSRYLGFGTLVRITDGTNTDYGIVALHAAGDVRLSSRVTHHYEADNAWVESMTRHPVDVNSASDEVLVACLENVSLRPGEDRVSEEEARNLVRLIREKPLEGLRDWRNLLIRAEEAGDITRSDMVALYRNALNPQDASLDSSTVPFCFKSSDTWRIDISGVTDSGSGHLIPVRGVHRFASIGSRYETQRWTLNTQQGFERQIIATRTGRHMTSYPVNLGERSESHLFRDLWPAHDPLEPEGGIQLRLERDPMGIDFPLEDTPEPSLWAKPRRYVFPALDHRLGLFGEHGTHPFSLSLWWKPHWAPDTGTHYLVDSGENTWTNRVSLFRDTDRQEIVFRVADSTLEDRAMEIRAKTDPERFLEETPWHRLTACAARSKPGGLTLLQDGFAVGSTSCLTRLTHSIPAKEDVEEIAVEDTSSFPEQGALVVRGGGSLVSEVFEYEGKSETSFLITRRFARLRRDFIESDLFTGIRHGDGTVELLGYTAPLITDLPGGGARLGSDLGEWHVMRVTFDEDVVRAPGNGRAIRGIAATRDRVSLPLGTGVKAWEPGVTDEAALRAFGRHGLALLVTPGPFHDVVPGQALGGWEIVEYEKTDQVLSIKRYQSTSRIPAAKPHFVPCYGISWPEAPDDDLSEYGQAWAGFPTALIPISIEATGAAEDRYLAATTDGLALDQVYGQIGCEWFAYTETDSKRFPGILAFVQGAPRRIEAAAALLDRRKPARGAAPPKPEQSREEPFVCLSAEDEATPEKAFSPVPPSAGPAPKMEEALEDEPPVREPEPGLVEGPAHAERRFPPLAEWERPESDQIPFPEEEFARRLGHRPCGRSTVADTWAQPHDTGDEVGAAFLVRFSDMDLPGFDDRVTLATGDGPVREFRIQHGYVREPGQSWVTLTESTGKPARCSREKMKGILSGTVDTRSVTRLLKFPSGELPRGLGLTLFVGGRFDGRGSTREIMDGLRLRGEPELGSHQTAILGDDFWEGDPDRYLHRLALALGKVLLPSGDCWVGDSDWDVPLRTRRTLGKSDGSPNAPIPLDGGVVRIGDELISYACCGDWLQALKRGAFGTEPAQHNAGARVLPVPGIVVGHLDEELSWNASRIPLTRVRGFPGGGGYVLIGDEIIGFTSVEGNVLCMPEAEDPDAAPGEDPRLGVLRARFGTNRDGHEFDSPVYLFTPRYGDPTPLVADPAASAAVVLRKRRPGARWTSARWGGEAPEGTSLRVLIRFDGSPAWDSDRIVELEDNQIPDGYSDVLYLCERGILDRDREWEEEGRSFRDRRERWPLGGLVADLIEVRVEFLYLGSCYPTDPDSPRSWKETPRFDWLEVDYIPGVKVLEGPDLR